MNQATRRAIMIACWFAVAKLACSAAAAQSSAPPSTAEQLQAQYKPLKTTRDSSGNVAVTDGTVLVVRKAGLTALPVSHPLNPCASTYADGRLKAPRFVCQLAIQAASRGTNGPPTVDLPVGQKAYPSAIAVDSRHETIKFELAACDVCSGADANYFKAEVDFQLPKGMLASGDISQVEDLIGQVLSIDTSGGDQAQAPQAAPAQPATAAAAREPVSIQQGQTIGDVEQALGKPVKTLTVANKVIYVYPDLKITFMNGKVTDVQ